VEGKTRLKQGGCPQASGMSYIQSLNYKGLRHSDIDAFALMKLEQLQQGPKTKQQSAN
jgi:hypothetical protein